MKDYKAVIWGERPFRGANGGRIVVDLSAGDQEVVVKRDSYSHDLQVVDKVLKKIPEI